VFCYSLNCPLRNEAKMTDPYRQFFLDTIENILQEEPNEESLYKLLRTATPNLTTDEIVLPTSSYKDTDTDNTTAFSATKKAPKALKTLKSRIHPDKHPRDERATQLFQNVQNFYDECVKRVSSSSASFSNHCPPSTRSAGTSSSSSISKNKRRRRSDSVDSDLLVTKFPSEFDVTVQWPHMNFSHPHPPPSSSFKEENDDEEEDSNPQLIHSRNLGYLQAYKCINARGAVIHGRAVERNFDWKNVLQEEAKKQQQQRSNSSCSSSSRTEDQVFRVFESIGGGCKELRSDVEAIKEELSNNGPVISVSFCLNEAWLNQLLKTQKKDKENSINNNSSDEDDHNSFNSKYNLYGGFLKERMGKEHELLIIGWCLTAFGEMWKVIPLHHSPKDVQNSDHTDAESKNSPRSSLPPKPILIGFGQFGIDRLCLAPSTNLDNLTWQNGPYFDVDFSDAPSWRNWKEMDLPLTCHEFCELAKCFPNGLVAAAKDEETFVVRDLAQLAHSAKYRLNEVRWEAESEEWIATVVLV